MYTCVLYYVYMQDMYVYMQDDYVYMQDNYVYMITYFFHTRQNSFTQFKKNAVMSL